MPTRLPLSAEQTRLAAMLPAAIAKECSPTAVLEDPDASAGVTCSLGEVRVSLLSYGGDSYGSPTNGTWTNACSTEDEAASTNFGVGGLNAGNADGCADVPLFAWDLASVSGAVTLASGTWKDARKWFIVNHVVGSLRGPIYGWNDTPSLPGASWTTLKSVALGVGYKTLLRGIEGYQDRLVHFKGRVSIVQDTDAYVDVTPIGYGLYDNTVDLMTGPSATGPRIISGDIIDFVGFVDGTSEWITGPIPAVWLVAYRLS